jgi:DnaJ family protein A protein 2
MPIYKNPFEKGNLIIKFSVDYPSKTWFTENSCGNVSALESILPAKTDQGKLA